MKKLKIKSILALLLLTLAFSYVTGYTFAYWSGNVQASNTSQQRNLNIGEWQRDNIPVFDKENSYVVGDKFIYGNTVWEVIGWFNPKTFLNADGTVNYNELRPYGPLNEVTNEYRTYNTYIVGDSVTYQGYTWIVRHEGANSSVPGSDTNAWNRISDEWFIYNTYVPGDIVTYNGVKYRNISGSHKYAPTTTWAWQLIQ